MKMKNFFSAVLLMAVSSSVSAQFASSPSASVPDGDFEEGWGSFYVQYNPATFSVDGGTDIDLSGVSIGYNRAFGISRSVPIYIATGLGVQYLWCSEDAILGLDGDYDFLYGRIKCHLVSLKLPVNLMYAYDFPNSDISVAPYVGLDFRYNVFGVSQETSEYSSVWYNLFDDDDMYGNAFKRFQVGWHIGVNLNVNKVMLGVSYGSDFSEIVEECRIKTTSFTLGFKF